MSEELRSYGIRGVAEHKGRCVESVMHGWHLVQCTRKCGHGPDGLYCRQHDPDAKAAKQAAEQAARKREIDALNVRSAALEKVVQRLGVGRAAWDGSFVTLTPDEAESLAARLQP